MVIFSLDLYTRQLGFAAVLLISIINQVHLYWITDMGVVESAAMMVH